MNTKEKLPNVTIDEDGILSCPCCGDQYMRQREVEIGWRREDGPVTRHVSTPQGVQTDQVPVKDVTYGHRRQYLTIQLLCEFCGGGFELCIYQHKGATVLKWVKLPIPPSVENDAEAANDDQVAGDLLADMYF